MLKVGITGGIGSGKTTVSKIFELLNVPVYYADDESKQLYHTNSQLMADVKLHFGDDIYVNGLLDKAKLAALVFADSNKLRLLNTLVHPATIQHAVQWMEAQTSPYVIKEAALLFESGSTTGLDLIVGVQAPQHLRIRRVMDRDGINRNAVLQRITQQIDEAIKMKLCDFIVVNDEQQAVLPQVLKLHQTLLKMSAEKKATSTLPRL